MTRYTQDLDTCVDRIIAEVGPDIVLALPLGLGKANHIANALFNRAQTNRTLTLHIVTALTLEPPASKDPLGQRFLQPILERIYSGYPQLEYAVARRQGTLPDNVKVSEFFLNPGKLLGNESAQQQYLNSNYTHAVRDLIDLGVNVIAQQVAPHTHKKGQFSLSCNPDVTFDLVKNSQRVGQPIFTVAQVNQQLPYLQGEAEVEDRFFDLVLIKESDKHSHHHGNFPLFAIPQGPVELVDYAIALHATSLIKDGGTLQIGIGSMGDAIAQMVALRHNDNQHYRELLDNLIDANHITLRPRLELEHSSFNQGLYANSEMFVEGLLYLRKQNVLARNVYPDAEVQSLLDRGQIKAEVSPELVKQLIRLGRIQIPLSLENFELLQTLNCLPRDADWHGGDIVLHGGKVLKAEKQNLDNIAALAKKNSGQALGGGRYCHAGFYIGSQHFYQQLRDFDAESLAGLDMCSVSYTNHLYGNETLKRAQRRDARFINTGMLATLTGAVVSDGLKDYQMVSGVGGQYNFIAQAQELSDGRSIICLPSTRLAGGELNSNIVWDYSHNTVPRHLRDIVVTEYGVADLRGLSDRDAIARMLCIADSRFQADLLQQAKAAGKIESGYKIPRAFDRNLPQSIDNSLGGERFATFLPHYPLGSDFNREEMRLAIALKVLKQRAKKRRQLLPLLIAGWQHRKHGRRVYQRELARLQLDKAQGIRERLYRLSLIGALVLNESKRPLLAPIADTINEPTSAPATEAA